jgi:hypothetical protein
MSRTRSRLPFVFVVAALVSSQSAHAEDAKAAEADALFREGRALLAEGNYLRACVKFAKSQRLDPAPGTAINLADCQEKVGKLADALSAARKALDLLPDGDDRGARIEEQIRRLEVRVPRLTLRLSKAPPRGTRILLDGTELSNGDLGTPHEVNPGKHQLLLVFPDDREQEHELSVKVGESRRFTIDVPPSTAGRDDREGVGAAPTPEQEQGASAHTLAYIVGGVGLAGIAVGIGYTIAAASTKDDAEKLETQIEAQGGTSSSACVTDPKPTGCTELASAWRSYDRDRNMGSGAFVVGGLGIGAAIVLLLTSGNSTKESVIQPVMRVGRAGGTILIHGSF